ncbi:hypothetical protein K503DRAFT_855434 [Rhizopogon vinicolor AM-OR11-026]|uniref:Uncharacterized protein n=1 Tax=Rhizopogon vinicolor AM-OR11-026 TaxID=1314800 RepID=A0A1B7N627_9AGAM|nr:hypothetical protein K503DRAFT_855434 [Rhizopogon vinicolor AM-OR11-026]
MPSEHDLIFVEDDSFPPWTDILRGFVMGGMLVAGFIGIESWVIDVVASTTTTIPSEHGFIYIEDDLFSSWTDILRVFVLSGMLNAVFIGTMVVLFIMGGLEMGSVRQSIVLGGVFLFRGDTPGPGTVRNFRILKLPVASLTTTSRTATSLEIVFPRRG